jgi:hypothetical protein
MTVTICWSVKGGTGTTVAVAASALRARTPITLIDLDGDLPAVLGINEPDGQGLADWFAAAVPFAAISDLAIPVAEHVRLVPRGVGDIVDQPTARWEAFGAWAQGARADIVIDTGTGDPPTELLDAIPGARRTLVTRACYLSLRRVAVSPVRPDGIVLIAEPGRRLRPADIERSVGAPIVATFSVDPAIARAVDAGLLAARLPRRSLNEVARAS